MICNRSCSAYSNTMKMHFSSRMISTVWTTLGWASSVQSAISLMADWEMPEYCSSPSLSGLNLHSSATLDYGMGGMSRDLLFDGKLAHTAILAFGLVDSSIGTATDETNNLVALVDSLLGVVPSEHCLCGISRIWEKTLVYNTRRAISPRDIGKARDMDGDMDGGYRQTGE
jgi:hypothetical protein